MRREHVYYGMGMRFGPPKIPRSPWVHNCVGKRVASDQLVWLGDDGSLDTVLVRGHEEFRFGDVPRMKDGSFSTTEFRKLRKQVMDEITRR
jgi:hypothetical protein